MALVCCLTGGVTSALLALRMASGTAACGISGGCELVQGSAWAQAAGVPLPLWGLAFFVIGGLAVLRVSERWPRWLRAWLGIGGIVGAGLLVIQLAVIGAVCPWCVCVDVAAIALGALAGLGRPLRRGPPARTTRLAYATAIAAAGLAPPLVVDLVWRAPVDETPMIEAGTPTSAIVDARDGVAQIVEFVDIQCPFCREQHARIAAIVDELSPDRFDVQVHHVPLPRHEHALDAARVACCGDEQGQERTVLDALMRADDISAAGCRRAALEAGLDLAQLDACLSTDRPDRRLAADRSAAAAANLKRLPTCVIGGRRLEGLKSPDELRDAVGAALDADPSTDCSG